MEQRDSAAMEPSRAQTVFQPGGFERYSGTGESGPVGQKYSQELQQPEPEYHRPEKATGAKKIFGNILSSLQGTHAIGEQMLHGDVPEAREDYAHAKEKRASTLTHLGQATTEEEQQQQRMRGIFQGERSAEATNRLMQSRLRKDEAETGFRKAQTDRLKLPFTRTARPGSMILNNGQVSSPGDPAAYNRGATTFGTARTAEGVFSVDRGTGKKGERLGGLPPVHGPGGSGGQNPDARSALNQVQRRMHDVNSQAATGHKQLDNDFQMGTSEKAIAKQKINETSTRELQKLKAQEDFLLQKMNLYNEPGGDTGSTDGSGDGSQDDTIDADLLRDRAASDQGDQPITHGTKARDKQTGEWLQWNEETQDWEPAATP